LIKISTNIDEVYKDFDSVLSKVADADKVLRTVALDLTTLITDRVQQKGLNSAGAKLKTKSNKTYGAYSEGYGTIRKEKGRQTEIVDLTMSGDMFSDLIVEPTGEREYSAGFRGEKSSQKAEYAEAYYGPIFSPTTEEEEFAYSQLERKLDEIFR
jgi:hypothetical protein